MIFGKRNITVDTTYPLIIKNRLFEPANLCTDWLEPLVQIAGGCLHLTYDFFELIICVQAFRNQTADIRIVYGMGAHCYEKDETSLNSKGAHDLYLLPNVFHL